MIEYTFKLYIYENSIEGKNIIRLIQNACREELAGRCKIEIIDIKKSPERLEMDNIFVFPTLIKVSPPPMCELIGDIDDKEKFISAINL